MIGRREFITLFGGAATWPRAAHAQQQAMPVIGFVRNTSLTVATPLVTAFQQRLKEAGFVEGQNVTVEYRSAEGHAKRLPVVFADVIRRPVAAIAANSIPGNTHPGLVAQFAFKPSHPDMLHLSEPRGKL